MNKTTDSPVGLSPSAPYFQPKLPGGSEKRAKCLFSFEKYKIPEEGSGDRPRQTGRHPTHTMSGGQSLPTGHSTRQSQLGVSLGLWLAPLPGQPSVYVVSAAFSPPGPSGKRGSGTKISPLFLATTLLSHSYGAIASQPIGHLCEEKKSNPFLKSLDCHLLENCLIDNTDKNP